MRRRTAPATRAGDATSTIAMRRFARHRAFAAGSLRRSSPRALRRGRVATTRSIRNSAAISRTSHGSSGFAARIADRGCAPCQRCMRLRRRRVSARRRVPARRSRRCGKSASSSAGIVCRRASPASTARAWPRPSACARASTSPSASRQIARAGLLLRVRCAHRPGRCRRLRSSRAPPPAADRARARPAASHRKREAARRPRCRWRCAPFARCRRRSRSHRPATLPLRHAGSAAPVRDRTHGGRRTSASPRQARCRRRHAVRRGRHDAPIDVPRQHRPLRIHAVDHFRYQHGQRRRCGQRRIEFAQQAADRHATATAAPSRHRGNPGASQRHSAPSGASAVRALPPSTPGADDHPRRRVWRAEQHRPRQQQRQQREQQQAQQQQPGIRSKRHVAARPRLRLQPAQRGEVGRLRVRCAARDGSAAAAAAPRARSAPPAAAARGSCGRPALHAVEKRFRMRAGAVHGEQPAQRQIQRLVEDVFDAGGCRSRPAARSARGARRAKRSRKSSRTRRRHSSDVPRRFPDRGSDGRRGTGNRAPPTVRMLHAEHFAARGREAFGAGRTPASSKPSPSISTSAPAATRSHSGRSLDSSGQRPRAAIACSRSRQRSRWRGTGVGGDARAGGRRRARRGRSGRPGAARVRSRTPRASSPRRVATSPDARASACAIEALASISEPHRQRAVALGLAHEIAVGARVQLPVDAGAARRRARRRGTARTRARRRGCGCACWPKPCAAGGASARVSAQVLQPRADVGGMSRGVDVIDAGSAPRIGIGFAQPEHAASARTQQRRDHVVGAALLGLGGERQQQAMAQHRRGERGDVFARHREAPVQQRARLRARAPAPGRRADRRPSAPTRCTSAGALVLRAASRAPAA